MNSVYGGKEHFNRLSTSILTVSLLLILLPLLATSSVFASEAALFEHTFKRAKGAPVTEKMMIDIPVSDGRYRVTVKNGLPDGSLRCSSADITINSSIVVGPSDLNQQISNVRKSIELRAKNLLSVTLNGEPGSQVIIRIRGAGDSDGDDDGDHDQTSVTISSWSVDPNPFSPNSDGIADKSTATAALHLDNIYKEQGYKYFLRSHWNIGTTFLKSDTDITYSDLRDWSVALDWDGKGFSAGAYPFIFYVELVKRLIVRDGEGHERDDDDHDGDDHNTGNTGESVIAKTSTVNGTITIELSLIKIVISTPADGEITKIPGSTVSGTVGDPQALITVNGIPVTNSNGAFQTPITLVYGFNTITVSATDATSASVSAEVNVVMDNLSPVISLSPVPEVTTGPAIEIKGNVDDVTATTVNLQGKSVTVPAGGGQFSIIADLVEGLNILTVTATDAAGNSTVLPMPITFDSISPVVAITSPLSGSYTNRNSTGVEGTVSDATAIAVTVNSLAAVISSGGFTISAVPLIEGPNQITATATDAAGHTGTSEITIISDTVSPVVTIDPTPEFSPNHILEIKGRVEDQTATTVAIQGKTVLIAAGGGTFSLTADLVEGMNDLSLTAMDSAGNSSALTLHITSDTMKPVVKINNPASNTYTDKKTIAVSGTIADATVTRVIVNGVEASVSSGVFTVPDISLGEGTNTINATATDATGNTASDEITIISDTVPPVITIDTLPGITRQRTIDIKGAVVDQTATIISLLGKTVSVPGGGGTFSLTVELTEGQNSISVSATDSAGNASNEQRSITLDTTLPLVKISSPATGSYINKGTTAVSGQIADATITSVIINGVDAIVADSGFSLSSLSLSEGSNTITATATDAAGNIGSDTVTVVADTIAPAITIDPTPQYTNQSSIEIRGRVDDQTASTITIQGTTVSIPAGGGPYAITVVLSAGTNSITAMATDSAGNTSEAMRTITADAVAPILKITSPVAGAYIGSHSVTVSGTVSESSSTKVVVNGQEAQVTGNSFTLQSLTLSEGSNAIQAEATDAAGNKGSDGISVISDTIAPVVTITAPADGLKTSNRVQTVSGSAIDASPIVSATLNDAPLSLASTAFNQQITLQEGSQTITVKATDKAGNIGTATVTVTLDDMAPAAPVLDALPVITNLLSLTLAGYSEPNAKIRISNGTETTSDAVGRFSAPVALTPDTTNTFSVIAVDAVGNEGEAATASIIQDSIAPYVTGHTLKADPKITLLIPIAMTFSEPIDPETVNSNNITVNGTSGLIDGTFEVKGTEVVFSPLSEFPANKTYILTIGPGIKDTAGNPLSPIYSSSFNTVRGPAFIAGEVYDDTTGLPLEGAMMKITRINDVVPEPVPSAVSDAMGRFSLSYEGVSGVAQIVIEKTGFSKVLRESYLWPNKSMTIFDGRLTPVITHPISATSGGTLGAGDTALWLPAGALASNADISVTALSQQGIGQRLPLGWSPIYGVDIAPSLTALNPPAQLTIRNIWSLVPGGFVVAYLDEGSRSWMAASHVVSPDSITVTMDRLGQYLLLLPDSLPSAPPMPAQPGDPILPSGSIGIDSSTAEVKVVPPAVLSREGAHGLTKVIMTTASPLPSGTALEARFTEQYTLKEGQVITPETYTQDITMYGGYALPAIGQPNTLSAEFPATPSKIYPLGQLYYGKVGIDIFIPSNAGQPADNVISESGGTVSAPDGTAIIIPPSSVISGTVFGVSRLLEQDLQIKGFPGLTFIGALNLQMDGGGFKTGVFPQFTVPGLSAPEGTRVIVSKLETMNGQNGLKAVAIGSVAGGKVVIDRCLANPQSPTPGPCIISGRYGFHIPSSPIGYITGRVLKEAVAVSGALLGVDNLPYKALSDGSGSFSMVSLAGNYAITALEPSTGQRVSETGTLAGEQTQNILLNLVPYHPTVLAVVPTDKTASIDLKAEVKVTFSDAVDPLTLDTNTFRLIQTPELISQPDIVIQGHISLSGNNNMAQFIPDAGLKPNATYRVKLTDGIKDVFGNSLVPFESVFTTSNVLGNEALPPGTLKASMPDADGFVTVRGGVGLTYGGAVVVIINRTKNITVTVIADEDGSFMAKVKADLPDEIVVDVKDLLGNTTTLSTGLLQSDDGTAAVGPKGGTIYGPGGIKAVVPEGAFDDIVVVKITMVPEETIKDVTMDPEMMPAGVFQLDSGGIKSKQEIKVSFPAPDWITAEHQILLAKKINIRGFDELTLACPAILKDDAAGQSRNIVSTSPPFVGVTSGGLDTYVAATWRDPGKGVGYALVQTWSPYETTFVMGAFAFVFPASTTELITFPVTVPVNQPYNLTLSNLEGPVKTISIQGPPKRGEFTEEIQKLENDPIPPSVFKSSIPNGATGILLADNLIIEMSEQIDPDTLNIKNNPDAVVVTDSAGNRVKGTFYLAEDRKTIVFVPTYGYAYNTKYTVTLNGIKDLGGNLLEGYSSTFTTFDPPVFSTVDKITNVIAIDKYRDYLVVTGTYTENGNVVEQSGIIIIDVSDPENPVIKGSAHTFGYDFDVKALPNITFMDRSGNSVTGDFAVVVGGQANTIGYLNFMNITDPWHPYIYEDLYLSWNPMYTEDIPPHVPDPGGRPYEVALLGVNAYVANQGLGLQAVDLTRVTPTQYQAQKEAIKGTIAELSYRSISKVNNLLLATKNHTLSIIDPLRDSEAPKAGTFSVQANPNSLTVCITAFSATDNVGVTGYMLTETNTTPSPRNAGWNETPPSGYTFKTAGTKTLYAWAKDAAGNITLTGSATVTPVITDPSTQTTFVCTSVPVMTVPVLLHDVIFAEDRIIAEIKDLNFPYEVTGVPAFPIDIDGDGNVGKFEDEDGDAMKSEDETFDLAFVSTADGVVIVNLNNPSAPEKLAVIPTGGLPGKIVINRAKRLAYTSIGNDLIAISLKDPRGIGLIDKDGDGRDDRIVAVLAPSTYVDENGQTVMNNYAFTAGIVQMDSMGRELLYKVGIDGKVQVVDLNAPRPVLKIVAYDDPSQEMKGAVTDGAALLRLQIIAKNGSEKLYKNPSLIIADEQGSANQTSQMGTLLDANGIEKSILPLTFNADGVAEAVYRAPDTFVRWGTDQAKNDANNKYRNIEVVLRSDKLRSILDTIKVKRPPVVLVHGLWGCGDPNNKMYAWKEFESKFNPVDKGLYDIFSVDYFERNQVRSITEHAYRLGNKMDNAFDKLKASGFAVSKADIIAHSMGGLLTRQYCFDNKTDCQNRVHRFITIATPHFGSELADLLLVYRDDRNNFPGPPLLPFCRTAVDRFIRGAIIPYANYQMVEPHPISPSGGAIDDLATGTLPPFMQSKSKTSMGRWADLPPLPSMISSHIIVGIAPTSEDGVHPQIKDLWTMVLLNCGIGRDNLFGSEVNLNDRIVKQSSQRGGVDSQYTTIVNGEDHFSVRNSNVTINKIRLLLDSAAGSSLFTK
ncbi:MAG: Ig-like domain-containing protein [Nitrospirae bacterium]|nr:Ig-like domain-containing protein [Nitrospirota bacterium]